MDVRALNTEEKSMLSFYQCHFDQYELINKTFSSTILDLAWCVC